MDRLDDSLERLGVAQCEMPGCTRSVPVLTPLAPVLCATCAFWELRGREAALWAVLGRLRRHDLYYLSPDETPLLRAPVLTVRLEDGTEITSTRVRCLGVPPHPVTVSGWVLLFATPRAPLGVR